MRTRHSQWLSNFWLSAYFWRLFLLKILSSITWMWNSSLQRWTWERMLYGAPRSVWDEWRSDSLWRLWKVLCGLKQAGRQRFAKTHAFLCDLRFQRCSCNLFSTLIKVGNSLVMINLYTDDVLMVGSTLGALNFLNQRFWNNLKQRVVGRLIFFLRLEIVQSQSECLSKLIEIDLSNRVFESFGSSNCKPVLITTESQLNNWNMKDKTVSGTTHTQKIGSLMYLMICARPAACYFC